MDEKESLSDADKIMLLAGRVQFAISFLEGTGCVMNIETGQNEGHWVSNFSNALRKCGIEIDDDVISYQRTPRSKRRGPEWKTLCEKLRERGYQV